MNLHISTPTAEVQQLKAAVLFLSIALACATQPSNTAMMRQAWRNLRPPLSDAEFDRLASVWQLEPGRTKL